MYSLTQSTFSTYAVPDTDILQSKILSNAQFAVFTNLRTEYAQMKLALEVDPNNIQVFIQNNAYLTGKIELLDELLTAHQLALDDIAGKTADNQEDPQ